MFKQLIENTLQGQVSDIERRKQEFMIEFAKKLAIKLKRKEEEQIRKATRLLTMQQDGIVEEEEKSMSEEDNAMSVDGDVSYCGEEMDEQRGELKVTSKVRLREANISLHVMEKQGSCCRKRIFVTEPDLHSSIASVAPSKSCDEIKASSEGDWEESGEEEESESF